MYGVEVEINLDLRFPRDAASVPAIRRLLDASLDVLGVEEPIRGDIRLMLTEACGNVIQHAHDGDVYTVRVLILDERCVIKVIDRGLGFEPGRTVRPVPAASDGGVPAEHGRGMMIMQTLADEVRLNSFPEQGALVALEKRLHYGGDTLGRRLADAGWTNGPPPGNRVRLMNEADPALREFATRLFNLAREGGTEQIIAHLDAGIPPNLTNEKGDTLLMLAAYHGHAATVRALAARGADPERENDRGRRPLAGAVFRKEPEVVRALLEAGADPRAGRPSAYDTAKMCGQTEFLTWFDEAAPSA